MLREIVPAGQVVIVYVVDRGQNIDCGSADRRHWSCSMEAPIGALLHFLANADYLRTSTFESLIQSARRKLTVMVQGK